MLPDLSRKESSFSAYLIELALHYSLVSLTLILDSSVSVRGTNPETIISAFWEPCFCINQHEAIVTARFVTD